MQNVTFILILLELKKCQGRKKSSFIDLLVIETFRFQASVVQKLDSAVHRINRYPMNKY